MECSTLVGILSGIIGVLSILVVVLISVQIYNMFNISKIKKDIDEKRLSMSYELQRNLCISNMSLSDFYYSLITKESVKDLYFKYINYRLNALLQASVIDEFQICDSIVLSLIETIPEDLHLSELYKPALLDMIQAVKQPKMIKEFHSLNRLILNL